MKPVMQQKSMLAPGKVIRAKRESAGLRNADLARRTGIHPVTLSAIETGRIVTPSLKHLVSISKVLGISIASLFVEPRGSERPSFLLGTQKGEQFLDFPKYGFRIVCYTPMASSLFIGKVVLEAGRGLSGEEFRTSGSIYVQPILGKITIEFDGETRLVKEGGYAFFDGSFPYSISNAVASEPTSFLLITSPSFLLEHGYRGVVLHRKK